MAFSAVTARCPSFLPQPRNPTSTSSPRNSISFRFSQLKLNARKPISIQAAAVPAARTSEAVAPAISLTDNALKHLNKMRSERNEDLCLRIGVKQGGCSGMSYTMEFENRSNARPDDSIIEYSGFVIGRPVGNDPFCDPKSLLFVFEDAVGLQCSSNCGGFSFKNPICDTNMWLWDIVCVLILDVILNAKPEVSHSHLEPRRQKGQEAHPTPRQLGKEEKDDAAEPPIMAFSSRLLSKSKQFCRTQIVLQQTPAIPVRFFAKQADPPALKGDEMLKGIFREVKNKFETAMGILRKEKITIAPEDPAAVAQYANVMKTVREKAGLFSESQRIQYTIQTRTKDIPDARTYLLALKEIRSKRGLTDELGAEAMMFEALDKVEKELKKPLLRNDKKGMAVLLAEFDKINKK
ncbi:putative ATP synthase 24 kDa subunit, mitochondrial [Morella rubra]|uniref:Putative ATP synthase 24 kDa subunit, mitochondrial n=1 Tax=Morella rubra TaxID=262757 RepID=A0A6A1VE41_9ROSI|nr:putative ATP synthase 24 kDa subunit, mitochondrial [Morella rubra]